MFREFLKYLFFLIILIFVQVTVLSNVNLGGYINPYGYLFFILMLPLQVPGWLLLISGFGTGLIIDLFSDSQGIHASATLVLAFARPGLINVLHGRSELPTVPPMISNKGIRWMAVYVFTLVFLHHAVLFFLEVFSLDGFLRTLAKILISSFFSSLIILLGYSLIDRPVRKSR